MLNKALLAVVLPMIVALPTTSVDSVLAMKERSGPPARKAEGLPAAAANAGTGGDKGFPFCYYLKCTLTTGIRAHGQSCVPDLSGDFCASPHSVSDGYCYYFKCSKTNGFNAPGQTCVVDPDGGMCQRNPVNPDGTWKKAPSPPPLPPPSPPPPSPSPPPPSPHAGLSARCAALRAFPARASARAARARASQTPPSRAPRAPSTEPRALPLASRALGSPGTDRGWPAAFSERIIIRRSLSERWACLDRCETSLLFDLHLLLCQRRPLDSERLSSSRHLGVGRRRQRRVLFRLRRRVGHRSVGVRVGDNDDSRRLWGGGWWCWMLLLRLPQGLCRRRRR